MMKRAHCRGVRCCGRDGRATIAPSSAAGVEILLLNGISFKVNEGEFLGVMGHTGAGKTTILKLLMRYYTRQW